MLFKDFLFNLNLIYNGEDDTIMNPVESMRNVKLWSHLIKWCFGKFFFFISKLNCHVRATDFLSSYS